MPIVVNYPGYKPLKGQLTFNDCVFSPNVTGDDKALYALDSELGTAFTNCTVHAPRADGNAKPELVDRLGFIVINKSLRHYYLNTKLGNDILHHALEEENIA